MTDAAAVEVDRARVSFGDVHAVADVALTIAPSEVHVLLGRSGSGKTTLLRAIAGFEPLHAGCVRVNGRVVDDGTRANWVPPEARRIGFVFQDYALFSHLDAAANIGFGVGGGRAAKQSTAHRWLRRVELDDFAARKPGELSGGEQQRVALARALAPGPNLVLLDEPFSNLDPHLRRQVRNDTLDLLRDSGATAIFVTHDIDEAFALADRLTVLDRGAVAQTGTPEQLYARPHSEAVARLAGPVALLPIDRWSDGVATTRFGATRCDDGAQLVVRPEQWRLRPGAGATVLRRRFRGVGYEYDVEADGVTYVVRATAKHEVGAAVALSLAEEVWALPRATARPVEATAPSSR